MARFSAREGRWIYSPKRHSSLPTPDPYKPGSPAYADRHKETAFGIASGMVRIDIGEPISGPKTP